MTEPAAQGEMRALSPIVEEGRKRAQAMLMENASEVGILGGARAYRQMWGRDSMICGLALMVTGKEAGDLHRRSLATLERFQSPLGRIPHNVGFPGVYDPALVARGMQDAEPAGEPVADTAHAGCLDNSLWYILGHAHANALDANPGALQRAWPSIEAAYRWLAYQDSNECGLLEAHEAMDWADLFGNRYNTLYANVLWFAAQKAMARMARALDRPADARRFEELAADVRFKVNTLLWVGPEVARDMAWVERHRKEWLYPIRLTETLLVERPFYLPYMAFRDYGDRFDTLGNLLAIFFGLADAAQTTRILDYIRGAGLDLPWPLRALNPPVHPGEKDWRDYYRVRNLNQPHQYHNGGAWPFIGGFYVAALVRAGRITEAEIQLLRLAEMNRQGREGEWEFNEWFHGTSGRPMGFPHQSWSAGMFYYAVEAVRQGRCPGQGGET